jgi:hypothetical protein
MSDAPAVWTGARLVPQRQAAQFIQGEGWRYFGTYCGSQDQCNIVFEQLRALGYNVTVRPTDSPLTVVEWETAYTSGVAEVPIAIWELLPARGERKLSMTRKFRALPQVEKDKLMPFIDNRATADDLPFEDDDPDAAQFYRAVMRGVEARAVHQPVLRMTQTVSSVWRVRLAITNFDRIESGLQLAQYEGLPVDLAFNLPNDVADNAARVGNDVNEVLWGWLKCFPTCTRTGFGRYNLTQDWEYGEWAMCAYDPAT